MIEQERKFLLLSMPETYVKFEIKQAYLILDGNKLLRVRIVDDEKAYLTFKTVHTSKVRTEYEYEIPISDAIEMYHNSIYQLKKTRYKTMFGDNYVDIDVYPDGLSVVEIEYEKELSNLPYYCGEEITGVEKYSNINIAIKQTNK
jgi:adenylate cyclase